MRLFDALMIELLTVAPPEKLLSREALQVLHPTYGAHIDEKRGGHVIRVIRCM